MTSLSYEEVKGKEENKFQKQCTTTTGGLLRVWPSGCTVTKVFPSIEQRMLNFEVREDDIWVVTYPRSGTTWSQEMAWLLANNLDYKAAKKYTLNQRFPFIDWAFLTGHKYEVDNIEACRLMEPPRFIKSHLPTELLPHQLWTKKPKIIYVVRNPKDVAVSYFHHYRNVNDYAGSIDEFLEAFLSSIPVYCPFWKHALGFWKMREEKNILYLTYEEMKKDLPSVIRKTALFFGKQLSNSEITNLENHLDFKSMKSNPAVNCEKAFGIPPGSDKQPFIRKGEVGSWKSEMSPEMSKKFDEWTLNEITGTGMEEFVKSNGYLTCL